MEREHGTGHACTPRPCMLQHVLLCRTQQHTALLAQPGKGPWISSLGPYCWPYCSFWKRPDPGGSCYAYSTTYTEVYTRTVLVCSVLVCSILVCTLVLALSFVLEPPRSW